MPKLSVRIPTLNNYPGLVRALKSILDQEFQDLDIVIVDNNSDDGSWPKIQSLIEQNPTVKAIQNPKRGMAENWNHCVESAIGECVLIFHTDDEMLPGMLEKAMFFLENNPSAGLVHTDCYDISDYGKVRLRKTQSKPMLKAGTEALTKIATDDNLACSSVIVKKQCYTDLGLFLPNNPSPDAEMWARIVSHYDMGHVSEPLVNVYGHLDSYGRAALSKSSPSEIENQWSMIGDKIISYFPTVEREIAIEKSKISMFNGLNAAGILAWQQHRWQRGREFMFQARKYTSFQNWVTNYIKNILRLILYTIKHPTC
ncbi:MAG: glycosyltransferase family 2 protein [Chloroflexi bacterium]|nr:glycosyltransferase family 2 protein [Chloroflexota bacterium]